jgi:hypothetical protein
VNRQGQTTDNWRSEIRWQGSALRSLVQDFDQAEVTSVEKPEGYVDSVFRVSDLKTIVRRTSNRRNG